MANELDALLKAINLVKGENSLSSAVQAEVARKAKAGIPLTNPTPQKQAIYDDYNDSLQSPKYGEEVARPTQEQALAGLINAIQSYRKDNPVELPFPAGTSTLAAQQFAEQQQQNAFGNQMNLANLANDTRRLNLSEQQMASEAAKAGQEGTQMANYAAVIGEYSKMTPEQRQYHFNTHKNQLMSKVGPDLFYKLMQDVYDQDKSNSLLGIDTGGNTNIFSGFQSGE
jgi:hypothetical protein